MVSAPVIVLVAVMIVVGAICLVRSGNSGESSDAQESFGSRQERDAVSGDRSPGDGAVATRSVAVPTPDVRRVTRIVVPQATIQARATTPARRATPTVKPDGPSGPFHDPYGLGVRVVDVSREIRLERAFAADVVGVFVLEVVPGSIAEQIGVRKYDVINQVVHVIGIGSAGLDVEDEIHFHELVAEGWLAGDGAYLSIMRHRVDGTREHLNSGEFPRLTDPPSREPTAVSEGTSQGAHIVDELGIGIVEVTPEIRAEQGLPDWVRGMLVVEILHGGLAHDAGIRVYDVITHVAPTGPGQEGLEVGTPRDLSFLVTLGWLITEGVHIQLLRPFPDGSLDQIVTPIIPAP